MSTPHAHASPSAVAVGTRHRAVSDTQEDRIRRVFHLAHSASLPSVNAETLRQYHEYLVANLSFPFEALQYRDDAASRQLVHYISVVSLTDGVKLRTDHRHGVLCKAHNRDHSLDLPLAELGVREENPNRELIDDYAYWFINSR